jgi:chemotaxis protein CheX
MGHVFQAATPSVIMGPGHSIAHVSSGPIMAVPFSTEHGEFTVEVSFE